MLKTFPCKRQSFLIAINCAICCAMSGCIESQFNLASESRLPRPLAVPPGLTRPDVSVTLTLYTVLWGPDAKFILIDSKWRKLAEVKGKVKNLPSSTCLAIVEKNGTTETVRLVPDGLQDFRQFGHIVALFYVVDDSTVSKQCPTIVWTKP